MNIDPPAGLPPAPEQMRAAAESACALLKVLSNPDRLLLLCELSQGERCVSDLESRLDIRQPTLSQQLGVLRDNALVRTRRDGKNIHYSLDSAAAIAVMGVLYEQFCGPAAQGTRDAA
ncbi:metalloregulator ArsR/SmtB family transcription factor [Burkholderia anthina]|uniref:ArsR/SmtB family transcription factor n=1 Tax=Burkholderia anthina TaxID=179879 RepID=UPI001CF55880|nr:metalloregulator ArsR/SmtB family transcription factor [Burkholderia anthina]MCA8091241.1 metalloregulator ArsR/SmtB family transcription factor [Burkholderia anthina]